MYPSDIDNVVRTGHGGDRILWAGYRIWSVSGVICMVEIAQAALWGRKGILMFIALSAGNALAEWLTYGIAWVR